MGGSAHTAPAAAPLWELCRPMVLIKRAVAAVAYMQQRETRLGLPACCVSAFASGRHPPMAVEDVIQVAMLLPPSGSIVLVCSCCCVWSAIVYGGGGCALQRGCGTAAPCLMVVSSLSDQPRSVWYGEATMVTTKPW
jgi:hypothetical protein